MSLVNVHNEWDPLEEMIVGIADGAQVPRPDAGLYALDYAEHHARADEIPSGPYPDQVRAEAAEDLDAFAAFLRGQGVTVRRPETTDHTATFGTPDWHTDGEYNYCPRDVLLPIGNTIIEAPMALRSRYFESHAYRSHLLDYFASGAQWIAAPRPRLRDATYRANPADGQILANLEPVFDAANVIRMGRDLLYLVSRSGNRLGLEWLQRTLGDGYRVHAIEGLYDGTHIDTTITLVRPGLVVLNPERITRAQVPEIFRNWEVIWCPEMVDTGYCWSYPRASIWQGMNFIMVNPSLAVVNDRQLPLIRALEKHRVDVAPLSMRHARSLSGGFHCVSVDVRRRGSLEDYR
ncbi:inosamine-phosphate amidinotransferase 1 [Burkholderia metallica]|uniref:Inosamine-phosphate amidinotransferase 1 n=1 Tax=Burkholderia metallica TaxID=488729 RepID=A0ABT8PDN7_9BURK|nr:inosamine-phosphate amidinotransferase 1 [Burkholderia metallica]MDN7933254.1 inosamine-phosphate amidinotransferase 1 [Burkholderia metallica]